MADLYEVLGLDKDAAPAAIKAAYKAKAKQHHPDKGGDRQVFEAVQTAYDTLSDADRRKRYDETGQIDDGKTVESHAVNIIASIFAQVLDQCPDVEHFDPIEETKEIAGQKLNEILGEGAKIEEHIRKMRQALARLTRKKDGDKLIERMIEGKIAQAKIMRGHHQQAIEAFKRALAILAEYKYRTDPAGFHRTYVRMGNQTTMTGSWT